MFRTEGSVVRAGIEPTVLTAVAAEESAEPVLDGRDFEHPEYTDGNFTGPILLGGVTGDMTIAREDIYRSRPLPRVGQRPQRSHRDGNGTRYGNASSTYTERGGEARRYRYGVDAGNIGINVGVCAPMGFFHFGGRKESFFGDLHAQGEDAIDVYTEKTVQIERWFS